MIKKVLITILILILGFVTLLFSPVPFLVCKYIACYEYLSNRADVTKTFASFVREIPNITVDNTFGGNSPRVSLETHNGEKIAFLRQGKLWIEYFPSNEKVNYVGRNSMQKRR